MAYKSKTWAVKIVKAPEPRVITISQPATIPPRPKWMVGESGYVESVARICPSCKSSNVWRGPWCHFPERYFVLVRMEPPVRHSGRARHCVCLKCGEFWSDIQAVPYDHQDWDDI